MSNLRELRERHGEVVERREGRLRDRPAWSVIWQQLMEYGQELSVEGSMHKARKVYASASSVAYVCGDQVEGANCYSFAARCADAVAAWTHRRNERRHRLAQHCRIELVGPESTFGDQPGLYQGAEHGGFVPWQGEVPGPLQIPDVEMMPETLDEHVRAIARASVSPRDP